MIAVIDNYDSFTYNLVQYLGELGADVQVHRNDRITVDEIERLGPEKIVISPGPCTPREAGISVEVIDPRTLEPLYIETILESVRKTGRAIVADEGSKRCGASAENSRRRGRYRDTNGNRMRSACRSDPT